MHSNWILQSAYFLFHSILKHYLTYKQESIQNSCFGSVLGVVKHKKTDLDDTLDLFEIRSKDLRDKVRSIVYLPDIKWAICFDLNFFFVTNVRLISFWFFRILVTLVAWFSLRCVPFVYFFLPVLPCKINKRLHNIFVFS